MVTKLVKKIITLLLISALAIGLFMNKQLIQIGSGYAAKVVCSNTFIAERDPVEVLKTDVQAPGHPLLKLARISVDRESSEIKASLFGLGWAGATATHQPGRGCTLIQNTESSAPINALLSTSIKSNPALASRSLTTPGINTADIDETSFALWPRGSEVQLSNDTTLKSLVSDAMLEIGTRAIVVIHKGKLIAEDYAPGFQHDTPQIGWSLSKTLTALLTGILVDDGLLSLTDKELFVQWKNDNRKHITVENLLHMESGLDFNESYGKVSDVTRMLFLETDMAGFTGSLPLKTEPGKQFKYASGTSNLLTQLLRNQISDDEKWSSFPYERVFKPLGMRNTVFEKDMAGNFIGSSYTYASARDWARFGQLLLQKGEWNGEQLVSSEWITFMTTPSPASKGNYGAHIWLRGEGGDKGFELPDSGYWLLGHDSQSVAVFPQQNLVVVRMGLTPDGNGFKPQRFVQALIETGHFN